MKKILIIEDDDILRKGIVETLSEFQYEVFSAENGNIGIQMALNIQPDIIICDIIMPGIDGYAVKSKLESDPITQNIPFIFLSAKADRDDIREGMNLGADDYITKPFDPIDLVKTIEIRIKKREHYESQLKLTIDKLEKKEKFISIVAHEYRGILTVIDLSIELLTKYSDKITTDQKMKYLEQIKSSSSKMNSMLNDILLFSKSSVGKIEPNPAEIQEKEFFNSIINSLDPNLERIVINYSQKIKEVLFLDDKIYWHILLNLITNAMKYSKDKVIIDISINSNSITVVIEDKGIGIPDNYISDIFQPFSRAKNVGDIPGSGLGLSIVKQMVDILQGQINYESEINKGTKFIVTVPA